MLQFLGKLFSPSKSKDTEEMEKDGNATVMNAVAEESRIVDSEMFVRSDGVPMAFMMPPQGMERQQVRELILISSQIAFLILYFVDQTVY